MTMKALALGYETLTPAEQRVVLEKELEMCIFLGESVCGDRGARACTLSVGLTLALAIHASGVRGVALQMLAHRATRTFDRTFFTPITTHAHHSPLASAHLFPVSSPIHTRIFRH